MTRVGGVFISGLVLAGCAGALPKISFQQAAAEGPQGAALHQSAGQADTSAEVFLESARAARLAVPVGAPMPIRHAHAWATFLNHIDQFLAQKHDAQWVDEAMRTRLRLEVEFQTDAHAFGDIDPAVALRVPTTLRALSKALAAQKPQPMHIDPRHFVWPVSPMVVSSPFGSRMHPIVGEPRFHAGTDLEVPLAHPVRAAETGRIVFAAWNGAHGKQIEIEHDTHWTTRYSHLGTLLVRSGTQVTKGQIIGLSGQTGLATGPHLHFELRKDGDALDPEEFLKPSPANGPPLISTRP